jgi:acyl-lipid omega-6 desaturase (Delta-12 desaturase)
MIPEVNPPAEPGDTVGLRAVTARFETASPRIAVWQIATSIVPLVAILAVMYTGMAFGWWPVLLLALPAAALTVRTFIIQHDCGHGSFFASRRANDWLGRCCGLLTVTPYSQWRRQHAHHHGAWNDLDRRVGGGVDIYSSCLTVQEYHALPTWQRRLYRAAKHPVMSLLVLPPMIFLVLYRFAFDTPAGWWAERRGVHLTNLSLLILYGGLAALLGAGAVAAVFLAVVVPASIVGVWLFSIQHHFDGTLWARHGQWSALDAALRGTSFLRLPRWLQWATGNIGFHHVHHVSSRVPNYRLEACHGAHPGFAGASVLTLGDGLRAWRFALWDEVRGRMVSFSEAAA